MLATDGAGAVHRLIERPLLIDEARILHDQGSNNLHKLVLLEELRIVSFFLPQHQERGDQRRLMLLVSLLRHDRINVRPRPRLVQAWVWAQACCRMPPSLYDHRRPSSPPLSSKANLPLCVPCTGPASCGQCS